MNLWPRATRIWPGLAAFDLPTDPATRDRYIRATICRLRLAMERDAGDAETPTLREARALAVDAMRAVEVSKKEAA